MIWWGNKGFANKVEDDAIANFRSEIEEFIGYNLMQGHGTRNDCSFKEPAKHNKLNGLFLWNRLLNSLNAEFLNIIYIYTC